MRFVFSLLLVLISQLGFGQNAGMLKGIVVDSVGTPLIGIDVSIKKINDSTIFMSTMTDGSGYFEMQGIPQGSYNLQISSLEYDNNAQNITLSSEDQDLGFITLKKRINTLQTVVVAGQIQQVIQKNDTSEYNAGAYKVNPDANAEDLIKKMPGIDVTSGTPKAQGENITKVLVDGKPFFGDDAGATLRNLPAEVINSIQVYDERSEQSVQSGFDDGQTTKTLNIVTRSDKKNGTFGRIYAGYGLPEYYNTGLVLNTFKNNRRITILGQSNNINIQNFSSQDLGGGNSGGGGRGGRRGGMDGNNDMMVNQKNGITRTHALGINYSDLFLDKIKLTGSYFFNNGKSLKEEKVYRSFVSEGLAGQEYSENNVTNVNDINHRANLRMEYQIDSSNYLMIAPSLKMQTTTTENNADANTVNNNQILSISNNILKSKFNSLNAGLNFLYSHKFKKEGRSISLWNNTSYNITDANSNLKANNEYQDTSNNYFIDQRTITDNNGWNTYANANYTEPISEKLKVQANAGIRYQISDNDKQTHDYNNASNQYDILAPQLSNKFESRYTTPFAGLALGYNDSAWMINVGANYQNAMLINERILPVENMLKRNFNNVLPYLAINYKFTNKKQFRFRFRTSTNAPSVSQLQDVIDNSNPLILRMGNPLLNQTQEYRFFTNYRSSNAATNTNFFIMAMGQFINDYIANNTIISNSTQVLPNGIVLLPGMQLILQENINGYYRLHTYASYGLPLKFMKSNLNVNGSITQMRTPGIINNIKNFANNSNFNLGVTISSNISERLDFTLISQSNYSFVKNTINTQSDNSFLNQNTRFDANYIFYKNFFLNSSINHQYYGGLSDGFNQNFVLWNAAVGTKFLKNNAAEIKLSVYDLLNQNQAVERTFTDAYTQDVRTNVLRQYFMLTFTYNLRYFKGGSEKDFNQENDGNIRPPNMRPH